MPGLVPVLPNIAGGMAARLCRGPCPLRWCWRTASVASVFDYPSGGLRPRRARFVFRQKGV